MATPRVLLVDDESAIRDTLGPFLQRSGFDVRTAADGEEALETTASWSPQILICDIMMPKADGRTVVRRLRADDNWTPVILLTHVGEAYERTAALDEGADDYLNKPFDPQELVARIRAVLRRGQAGVPSYAAASVLSGDGLVADRASRRFFLHGKEINLTPKASMLLDYFMTHPGELLSRDRLLADLWGYDFPVSSRAVDHRIAELRRVLHDNPAEPTFIETVQTSGYRYRAHVNRTDPR